MAYMALKIVFAHKLQSVTFWSSLSVHYLIFMRQTSEDLFVFYHYILTVFATTYMSINLVTFQHNTGLNFIQFALNTIEGLVSIYNNFNLLILMIRHIDRY